MNKIKKQGNPVIHEQSLKIALAREYLTTDLGYGRLSLKYGIPQGSIQDFVKWYRKNYPDGNIPETSPPLNQSDTEKALKEANLKISALELLIENAGKELGVDIVKKLGTKQSGK